MNYDEIRMHLDAIETKEQYDIVLSDHRATISVFEYDFDVNGLTYMIDGYITRNVLSHIDATHTNPEETELSEEGRFDGTLVITDQDGEELYFDDLNLIIK